MIPKIDWNRLLKIEDIVFKESIFRGISYYGVHYSTPSVRE